MVFCMSFLLLLEEEGGKQAGAKIQKNIVHPKYITSTVDI